MTYERRGGGGAQTLSSFSGISTRVYKGEQGKMPTKSGVMGSLWGGVSFQPLRALGRVTIHPKVFAAASFTSFGFAMRARTAMGLCATLAAPTIILSEVQTRAANENEGSLYTVSSSLGERSH